MPTDISHPSFSFQLFFSYRLNIFQTPSEYFSEYYLKET